MKRESYQNLVAMRTELGNMSSKLSGIITDVENGRIIELRHPVLTHMLGYLKPEQWADALKNEFRGSPMAQMVMDLLEIQDATYGGGIKADVDDIMHPVCSACEGKGCSECGGGY